MPSPQTSEAATPTVRNLLFIMCDQLRADVMSIDGGPIPTPNIARLAARGVRFDRAFVNAGVCGPSRTSFYTGRYPVSHRVTWNRVPMPVDEPTLGHYLMDAGLPLHLLGKTHFVPDTRAASHFGYQMDTAHQALFREGGFVPIERYDGHFEPEADSPYRQYLLARGYDSQRPWSDFVIGSRHANGSAADGWLMRHATLPALVRAEDSETAYLTQRAIDFMTTQADRPWALHLSYIKPHWPYKAPRPYHAMFGPEDCLPPTRDARERNNPHPVFGAYQRLEESMAFARDEVWQAIRPVTMGLVKQIDDEIGRLLDHMESLGRLDDTLVVFTSDHGDLAGDHWLGEKEYFFDSVMRVPLIVADPHPQAQARHGSTCNQLVESVDVVPTVLAALGCDPRSHRVEGHSLLALTRADAPTDWRDCVFGQLDYAYRQARQLLGRATDACQGFMVRDARYKFIAWEGYADQLFDLQEDPNEFDDHGTDPAFDAVRNRMRARLQDWFTTRKHRASETLTQVEARTHAHERMMGIQIGRW